MITKCLLPVAGYGTRFLPATKAIPKEMLPILTKPLIQYAVEEAITANIHTIAMVTNPHKQAIKAHFRPHPTLESTIKNTPKAPLLTPLNLITQQCTFSYIEQTQMLGLGHAIHTGKPLIGNTPFAVILPDDLCITPTTPSVLAQMTHLHAQHPTCCIVAIEPVPLTQVHQYGIIDGTPLPNSPTTYRVHNMLEKPTPKTAPTNLAIIGRYILTPEIFPILATTPPDKNGEIQLTDALMTLAQTGKVLAHQFQGTRYDCGTVKGFVQANTTLAQTHL